MLIGIYSWAASATHTLIYVPLIAGRSFLWEYYSLERIPRPKMLQLYAAASPMMPRRHRASRNRLRHNLNIICIVLRSHCGNNFIKGRRATLGPLLLRGRAADHSRARTSFDMRRGNVTIRNAFVEMGRLICGIS